VSGLSHHGETIKKRDAKERSEVGENSNPWGRREGRKEGGR